MLVSFTVQNFRSIVDKQELTFIADRYEGLQDVLLRSSHVQGGVLPALAIFGANGTGKTNMLRALDFLFSAIKKSHNSWHPEASINQQPHFFHEGEPTQMECRFILQRKLYRFILVFDRQSVIKEALYNGKERIYSRNRQRFSFGPAMEGFESTRKNTRRNSLFLSSAAQNNHPVLKRIHAWFSNCDFVSDNRFWEEARTANILDNEDARAFMTSAIGLINPQIVEIQISASSESGKQREDVEGDNALKIDYERWLGLKFVHQGQGGERATLRLSDESKGTQSYLALIGSVIYALHRGSILLLDEADMSLHPMLLRAIVALFQSPDTNAKQAQLVFNTHDVTLLSPELLRPDQVWFADFNGGGGSRFYSLADFEGIRSDTKAQKAYLEGRFGSVPFLDDHLRFFKSEISAGKG